MDPLTAVAVLAVVGAAVGLPMALHARQRRQRAVHSVWAAVAARRQGRATSEELVVDVDDVRIHVTQQAVVKGQPDIVWYVRARADYVCGHGPAFEIAEQGFGAALGRSVGLRVTDVTFGDPAFEEQFVVRTEDATSVLRAWSEGARHRLLRIPQQKWAHADGRTVVVEVEESQPTATLVETLIDVAASVASYGRGGLEQLRALPGAHAVPRARSEHGYASVELGLPHATVSIGPRSDGPVGGLVAWTRVSARPAFVVAVQAGTLAGEVPRGLLSPAAAAALPRVGDADLESDGGELRVIWPEWPSADSIEAGAELLDALAAPPSGGAFR